MKVTHSIDIAAPAAVVWQFLEEPEKQKLWMKGLLENVSTSDDPKAVGATFRMKLQEGARQNEYRGEITAYDAPRRLSVALTGKPLAGTPMDVDYHLSEAKGRTRLDYHAVWEPKKLLLRLLAKLASGFARRQIQGFLGKLKDLAEMEEKRGGVPSAHVP